MKAFLNIIVMMAFAIVFTVPAMAQKSISVLGPNVPTHDGNVRVSQTEGVQNVILGSFQLKAAGGDCSLVNTTIQLLGVGYGSSPTTLKIFEGNTLISSVAVQQLIIGIPLVDQVVSQNTTRTFTLKGDFPSTAAGTCQVKFLGVRWLNSANADTATGPSGGDLYGPTQHFFSSIAGLQLASVPTATATTQNGFTTQVVANFSINVTADGANLLQPVDSDAVVVATYAGTGETIICPQVSVVTTPNNPIADGSTGTVTVSAKLPASSVPHSGVMSFALRQFAWRSGTVGEVVQTWGLNSFVTPVGINFLKNEAPPPTKKFPRIGSDLYLYISYLLQYANGGFGQVVGEGGSLVFTPTMTNPIARVVFPNNAPDGGNTAQVAASVSATEMIPFITAPVSLAVIAPVTYTNYPVSNVQAVSVDGVTMEKTFDVVLGEVTLHGLMIRTGSNSCEVKFFWGAGSGRNSPGDQLDLLNLSPGKGENQPPRFKFKATRIRVNSTSFDIDAHAIPGTFQVLASSDLVAWSPVTCIYAVDSELEDTEGSMPISVSVAKTAVGSADRCFFRLLLVE